MHIRRPRAMRASVGRAGCALAAARARASVALAAHWLVAAAAPLRARASVALAAHWLLPRDARASVTLAAHACCASPSAAPYKRAQERARAETGSGKGVRARGAYTRARLARRMTATMMASGPASGERTIMTVLPRLLREVRRRALRARTRAKRILCAVCSSRTLKPHAQAARSSRTLKLHAQALRLRVSWRRHFGGQQGSSLQIDGCRRCGSDRSTQRCGVTRFGPRGVTELGKSREMCFRCV